MTSDLEEPLNNLKFFLKIVSYGEHGITPDYADLVYLARRSPYLRQAFHKDLEVTPLTIADFHTRMLIWGLEGEDDDEAARYELPTFSQELGSTIENAKSDAEHYDALSRLSAYCLKEDLPLPPMLSDWLISVMLGENIRPKQKKGPFVLRNINRDKCITMHFHYISMTGASITENEGSYKGQSACHAVNEALSGSFDVPSPKTLMNIWSNRSQSNELYNRYALLFYR